jgi:predicted nucleotidyltransferase
MAELVRLREEILAVAARHGASNVRVFGSVARGDADAASDIDFLVDFEEGRSLLDLASLLVDLEDLLGLRVDVVTEPGLKARIRQRVLAEAVAEVAPGVGGRCSATPEEAVAHGVAAALVDLGEAVHVGQDHRDRAHAHPGRAGQGAQALLGRPASRAPRAAPARRPGPGAARRA